jgi:hypothetical protein
VKGKRTRISHVIARQKMHLKLPLEILIVIAPADQIIAPADLLIWFYLFLQLLWVVFKYWHSVATSRLVP